MTQPKKPKEPDADERSMDRLDEALKKMLTTPHETNKEMVERRRRQGMRSNPRRRKQPNLGD